jgi:hypothetical protein
VLLLCCHSLFDLHRVISRSGQWLVVAIVDLERLKPRSSQHGSEASQSGPHFESLIAVGKQ